MGFYQKRPVVIEAKQWRGSNPAEVTDWLDAHEVEYCLVDNRIHIKTLEGVMAAQDGDMVIKGVKGEFYPCRLDIFAETYESVRE